MVCKTKIIWIEQHNKSFLSKWNQIMPDSGKIYYKRINERTNICVCNTWCSRKIYKAKHMYVDRFFPQHQRSAIGFVATHKHSWNFEYNWVIEYWNLTNLLWFIHSYSLQPWFICTGCNGHAYNVDIKLIPFAMCLIHKPTHFNL